MKIDLLWLLSWIVYYLKKNFITFEGFLCLIRLLMRKSATPQEIVTPDQALEWCQNYLRGAWSSITVEQMLLERVSYVYFNRILFFLSVILSSGGLSNYLYCCSLPDDVESQGSEPRKVLLR